MSLKEFHIFFIAVSSLTLIGFGVWCFVTPTPAEGSLAFRVMGAVSGLCGLALIVYGKKFLEKMKREGI